MEGNFEDDQSKLFFHYIKRHNIKRQGKAGGHWPLGSVADADSSPHPDSAFQINPDPDLDQAPEFWKKIQLKKNYLF
jgi:hypothetical protein